jgi:branched-chain amino acid transport system substrate-binding protein
MNKTLTLILASLLCLTTVWAKETIKIGMILPLTGNLAAYGTPVRDAALMALDEVNKEDRRYHYELIAEDNQQQPAKTILAARKLMDVDKVDFLYGLWSNSCYPIAPIVRKAHLPMLVLTWNRSFIDGKTTFALATSAEKEMSKLLATAEALGEKRVAIIYGREEGIDAAFKAFESEVKKTNFEVVSVQGYMPGERDFSTIVLKAREAKPDLLINISLNPEIVLIEKKIKELGVHCDVSTLEAYDTELNASFCQGRWYVSCAQGGGAFAQAYRARYQRDPEYGTGFAYDSIRLIADAFEQAGSGKKPSPEQIAAYLNSIKDREGATGTLTSDGKGMIDTPARLLRVSNGKAEPITVDELLKLSKP